MSRPLIVGAMQGEIDVLQNVTNLGFDILKTGIGTINTVLSLNDFLIKNTPKFILNLGVVGAFDPEIKIGEIIVPDKIYNGNCSQAKNGNLHRKRLMQWKDGEMDQEQTPLLTAKELREKIIAFFKEQKIDFYQGTLMSGDMWSSDTKLLENLQADYEIICEDMEAWPVAFLCKKHQIPFATVKIVSNNNLHNPDNYDATVSKKLQNVLIKFLKGENEKNSKFYN